MFQIFNKGVVCFNLKFFQTYTKVYRFNNVYLHLSLQGNSSMKRPPAVLSSEPHILYDSCVNNITSPSMYIVFERDQCYPQYLITFVLESEKLRAQQSQYIQSAFPSRTDSLQQQQQAAIDKIRHKVRLKPLTTRPSKAMKRQEPDT